MPNKTESTVNLDLLLKLRAVVARFGEMDVAKWWNTRGQLGPLGASALRRGFPRTHRFAQARSVFAVAAHRCDEVFAAPDAVTLWRMPEEVEEQFDARWETWLDNAHDWNDFFLSVERFASSDLTDELSSRGLIDDGDMAAFVKLKRGAQGRNVLLPGEFEGLNQDIKLLALAFGRSEVGELAVPYMRRGRD